MNIAWLVAGISFAIGAILMDIAMMMAQRRQGPTSNPEMHLP